MQLFSEVSVPKPNFRIGYKDPVFCLGSCFVNEIGQKIQQAKFNTLINPFGTQFHPRAMENVFARIYMRTEFTANEIVEYQNLFFSWDHSADFSAMSRDKALAAVNESMEAGNAFIQNANVFIFTLGTAWAYRLKDTEVFVSNCHKVPQQHFTKELLSFEQVYTSVRNLVLMARDVRPNSKIIFTISPVRHKRDGFVENNVSKGLLHQALFQIRQEMDVMYFPAYEIVLDELRDYRYYASDLVHVNELGIHYIWEKFRQHYFSEESLQIMQEVAKIRAALQHKAAHPGSIAHKTFLYNTLKAAKKLSVQLPKDALTTEINELNNRLHAH